MKINLEDALSSLEDARHIDVDEAVANALFRVGVAYLERDRVDEAYEALDEAYYHCRKLENQAGQAQVCLRLAEVAAARSDYPGSLELLHEALKIFRDLNDREGQAGALERLGRISTAGGQESQAVAYFEQALEITTEGGDEIGQMVLYQHLAPLFRRLDRHQEAQNAYRNLGRLADALGDSQRVALALVGIGSCLVSLHRENEAVEAFNQAKILYNELGQLQLASQVEAEISRLGLPRIGSNGEE